MSIQIAAVKASHFVKESLNDNRLALRWLGQAGFELFYKNTHILIDPYLSDYLAKKYKGKEFPHIRLIPLPIQPEHIKDLDWVLCTHRHSDHMDPEALPVILKNNPNCKMVAPKAERTHIQQIGIDIARVTLVNAGDVINLASDVVLEVLASAHEDLETDEQGNHRYLGFVLRSRGARLYHSGDCIPYAGLASELKGKKIDISLLPVNGRDDFRRQRGIPGNFTFEEAGELCRDAGIPLMICHHFGMFDFNTINEDLLRRKAKDLSNAQFRCVAPQTGIIYTIAFQ